MPTLPNPDTALPRRDWSDKTPPFRLTAEQRAICTEQARLGWLDETLARMQRAHCYAHRPILGLGDSLTVGGDLAFERDWEANRAAHMAEAWAEFHGEMAEAAE